AHADHTLAARGVAAIPPAALVLGVELLMMVLRRATKMRAVRVRLAYEAAYGEPQQRLAGAEKTPAGSLPGRKPAEVGAPTRASVADRDYSALRMPALLPASGRSSTRLRPRGRGGGAPAPPAPR